MQVDSSQFLILFQFKLIAKVFSDDVFKVTGSTQTITVQLAGGKSKVLSVFCIFHLAEASCHLMVLAFWERGSSDLPACGLRRGSRGGPARPIFISTSSRPSRGAKPRREDDRGLPQARPRQACSRGGGEIKVGYLMRCS